MRAQLRVPLWNDVRSYFSFGECTRSSSSAKPTAACPCRAACLKSPTIGIDPPEPTATALRAPFRGKRACAPCRAPDARAAARSRARRMGDELGHAIGRQALAHEAAEGRADLLRVLLADQAERDLGRGFGRNHGLCALARYSRRRCRSRRRSAAWRSARSAGDPVSPAGDLQADLAEEILGVRSKAASHRPVSAGEVPRTPS